MVTSRIQPGPAKETANLEDIQGRLPTVEPPFGRLDSTIDRRVSNEGSTSPSELRVPDIAIVIPTRNEAGNIVELLRRLDSSLGDVVAEVIFVDDSDDDTPLIIERSSGGPRSVQLVHRSAGQRQGGLGGAVVTGFRQARAPWAVVMDGDLQHPPELVRQLFAAACEPGTDLVIGTRYSGAGDAGGLAGNTRMRISALCTAFATAAFPRRLQGVSDPMSGFFAVRLGALDLPRLKPPGYKILLEILAGTPLVTREVPFSFQSRFTGESKASISQGLTFVWQLVKLRVASWLSDVTRGRRRAHSEVLRLILPLLLALVAFPNLASVLSGTVTGSARATGSVVCGFASLVTAAMHIRPRRAEVEVHDRQVDVIFSLPLFAVALWMSVAWPSALGFHAELTDHEVIGAVALVAAGYLLLLGTRAAMRLRLSLVLGLLAMPTLSTLKVVPILAMAIMVLVVVLGLVHRSHLGQRRRGDLRRASPWPAPALSDHRPPARIAGLALAIIALAIGLMTVSGVHRGQIRTAAIHRTVTR